MSLIWSKFFPCSNWFLDMTVTRNRLRSNKWSTSFLRSFPRNKLRIKASLNRSFTSLLRAWENHPKILRRKFSSILKPSIFLQRSDINSKTKNRISQRRSFIPHFSRVWSKRPIFGSIKVSLRRILRLWMSSFGSLSNRFILRMWLNTTRSSQSRRSSF